MKDIGRATHRQFSAEEKIRIVLEGGRGEEGIAELCRREGIASSMYYGWSRPRLCRCGAHWRHSASRAPRSCRWYDRYRSGGVEALADYRSRPDRVWNKIPEPIRAEILELAQRETELSRPSIWTR